MRLRYATLTSTILAACFLAVPAAAQSGRDAPVTPATHHHGLPGNNPAYGGSSANPNGKGVNDGNGMHGIANVPGQNPTNYPGVDGTPGFASQLGTVHGGLGGGHSRGGGNGNGHGKGGSKR